MGLTRYVIGWAVAGQRRVVVLGPLLRVHRGQKAEGHRAQSQPRRHHDSLLARAGHPHRRMRLLDRLGNDVARRHLEVLAVVAAERLFDHHAANRDQRLAPHRALFRARDVERVQFGKGRRLAGAELGAPVAQQVEHPDPLRHPRRMVIVGRQQRDSRPQAHPLGALAGRGQKTLARRGVRVFLQEMMLDLPQVVDPDPVGEFDLLQRLLNEFMFASPAATGAEAAEFPVVRISSRSFLCTRQEPWPRISRNRTLVMPPSTRMSIPVTKEAFSEHRNVATSAISSPVPQRPTGVFCSITAIIS